MTVKQSHAGERTAVVVCAHRPYPTLELCLQGFRSAVDQPSDVIFVDNGSCDMIGDQLALVCEGITVIRLERNVLFCAGYNAGIRRAMDAGYDFVLMVNADTELVDSSFIGKLVTAARRWPHAAFLGPLVHLRSMGEVQQTCLPFPSIWRGMMVWIPWRLWPGLFAHPPARETKVPFLNGVCVLCRVAALQEIGLMDEAFGGYCEDADWSWRARQKGWASVFVPVPSIIHHEEPVGYEHFSLKSYLLKRNKTWWFLKTGKRVSAHVYALLSLLLARLRMWRANHGTDRKKHEYFFDKLKTAYANLLRGSEHGEWCGPALGDWEMPDADQG